MHLKQSHETTLSGELTLVLTIRLYLTQSCINNRTQEKTKNTSEGLKKKLNKTKNRHDAVCHVIVCVCVCVKGIDAQSSAGVGLRCGCGLPERERLKQKQTSVSLPQRQNKQVHNFSE